MIMRLALALGQPSPSSMARAMTAEDYALWSAWERANGPIGPARDDLRVAAAAAAICNMIAAALGAKRMMKNRDLVPFACPWGQGSGAYHVRDPQAQIAIFRAMAGSVQRG